MDADEVQLLRGGHLWCLLAAAVSECRLLCGVFGIEEFGLVLCPGTEVNGVLGMRVTLTDGRQIVGR